MAHLGNTIVNGNLKVLNGAQVNSISGNGSGLTALNASSISSGTLSAARLATSGAAAGSYGESADKSPGYAGAFNIPYVTVDTYGRVTAIANKKITLPNADNTDTKNTAGSTNSTSKLFLVGATSQAANPQTYSNSKVYETDGALVATSFSGSGASLTSLNASNISSGTLAAARLATSGVTAGSYGPSADVTGSHNATISVPYITVDTYGRVTSIANKTYTSKNDNTTYSAGTTAQLVTGTDTANRVWPAKQISDYVKPRAVEFIAGTQTAATGAFTGVTKDDALYDGKTIFYYLPYNGSGNATLNLTLSGGGTTGAKVVYFTGTSRLTTHYGAGSCFHLTYRTSDDAWHSANYDSNSNNYDRRLHNNNVKAAAAITAGTIIVGTSAGYKTAASGVTFDIAYPILYASAAIASGAAAANTYEAIPTVNLATTKASWTGTQYAMAFLVGTLSGNTFTIDASIFTTTIPTSADGKVYIPVGLMASTNQIFFASSKDMYQYTNGSFHLLDRVPAITNITRSGTTFTATKSDGSSFTFTQQDNNTTYSAATQSAAGLMSAADKKKLDGVATGANAYTHPNTVTAGTVGTSSATSGSTLAVPYITYNANGHITATGTHTHTISGFAASSHTHNYAGSSSAGGAATTALKVQNSPAAGADVDLVYSQMGANDYFRIRTGGASNAGYAELATADDGTEPIYVRQYTGVFSSLVRTATLLDGSGNTILPGSVTVGSHGTIAYNSATGCIELSVA